MLRTWTLSVVAGLAFLFGACEAGPVTPDEPEPLPSPVISEYRPYVVTADKREVGAACADVGPEGCASGICLQSLPGRTVGQFCTQACRKAQDCPARWRCSPTLPSPGSELCFPPDNWNPGARAGGNARK